MRSQRFSGTGWATDRFRPDRAPDEVHASGSVITSKNVTDTMTNRVSFGTAYAVLWERFGEAPFVMAETETLLSGSRANRGMTLTRLIRKGWAVRLGRGRYVLLRPVSPISEAATGWPARVPSRAVRDLLRLSLSALDSALGARLTSLALYGSYARRTARPESDVDLLVVVDQPLSAPEEARAALRVRTASAPLLGVLWESAGIHPAPSLNFLSERDVQRGSSFLLDLTREAVLLYDLRHVLGNALKALEARAEKIGVRRAGLPGGRWYWTMPAGVPLSALSQGG
jgi:predicted nucleotidyltransferase